MAERPAALQRVDAYLSTARLTHEVIWDLHQILVVAARDDPHTRDLLDEAARVVVLEMPTVAQETRRLGERWYEQDLLDPTAAKRTLDELDEAVDAIEPELRRLRFRQNEIAAELRRLARRTGG